MQLNETAIVWFTQNLRIQDNRVLFEACSKYERVIAVYCFEKKLFSESLFQFKRIEKYRAKFLRESVQSLYKQLKELNISLLVYFDDPGVIVPKICMEHKATAIFFQKEFTTIEEETMNSVSKKIPKEVAVYSYYDQFLFHPDTIPFDIRQTPEVFTIFRKKIEKKVQVFNECQVTAKPSTNLIKERVKIPNLIDLGFSNFDTPSYSAFPFKGGEDEAQVRLDHYFFKTKKLAYYKKTRNGLVGTDYSTKFSPWLANGALSPRTIYWAVKSFEQQYGSNQSTYWLIFELIWRDYFKYLALKHRNRLFKQGGFKGKEYEWKYDDALIKKWINGETSEPFVNANMIELKQTGWMSNRGRQNVASYFAKELLLDWRIGAAYFESMLIDYDVHSNYGNWQYVAGVGNDPRDRKFNVSLQAERYDAHGKYQGIWLQPKLF